MFLGRGRFSAHLFTVFCWRSDMGWLDIRYNFCRSRRFCPCKYHLVTVHSISGLGMSQRMMRHTRRGETLLMHTMLKSKPGYVQRPQRPL